MQCRYKYFIYFLILVLLINANINQIYAIQSLATPGSSQIQSKIAKNLKIKSNREINTQTPTTHRTSLRKGLFPTKLRNHTMTFSMRSGFQNTFLAIICGLLMTFVASSSNEGDISPKILALNLPIFYFIQINVTDFSFWWIRFFKYKHYSLSTKRIFINTYKTIRIFNVSFVLLTVTFLCVSNMLFMLSVESWFSLIFSILQTIFHYIYKTSDKNKGVNRTRLNGGSIGIQLRKLERQLSFAQ